MNVIYIGCFRLPNHDAAAPRVLNIARIMKMCGHQVSFISWGGKYNVDHLCEDGKYRIDGMEYIITDELDPQGTMVNKMMQLFHRGDKSIAILKAMDTKPDLIVLYNAGYGWTSRMLKFCKKYNIKLANDITEWYDDNELHFWDRYFYHVNMTKLQRKVNNKFCISSYLNDYYSGSNNLLLPPLCDHSEAKWSATIDDDCIKPLEGLTLIYAGNPAKKDCVHTVINVVNKLVRNGKDIRFLILGTTRESFLERYSYMLESKDLHENILFLGRVSQDLIPAYYKKADFMVLLRESTRKNMAGFPTKFAESMSAGIPVIANATSDLGKYIVNGKTGFIVDDEKAESLEKTLYTVLNLSRDAIEQMKLTTKAGNEVFDYRHRKAEMEMFLNNLK